MCKNYIFIKHLDEFIDETEKIGFIRGLIDEDIDFIVTTMGVSVDIDGFLKLAPVIPGTMNIHTYHVVSGEDGTLVHLRAEIIPLMSVPDTDGSLRCDLYSVTFTSSFDSTSYAEFRWDRVAGTFRLWSLGHGQEGFRGNEFIINLTTLSGIKKYFIDEQGKIEQDIQSDNG